MKGDFTMVKATKKLIIVCDEKLSNMQIILDN